MLNDKLVIAERFQNLSGAKRNKGYSFIITLPLSQIIKISNKFFNFNIVENNIHKKTRLKAGF